MQLPEEVRGSVLSRHKKVLSNKEDQYECHCRNKGKCPLDNTCLTLRVIYQAEVLTNLNDPIVCSICLTKTFWFIKYLDDSNLNKKSKLISKFQHQNKFMISSVKD